MGGAIVASGESDLNHTQGIFVLESFGKIYISLKEQEGSTYCIFWAGQSYHYNLYFSSDGISGTYKRINLNSNNSLSAQIDDSNSRMFIMKVEKENNQFNCYINKSLVFSTDDRIYFGNAVNPDYSNDFSAMAYVFE